MGQNIPPREIRIWKHSPSGKLYAQSRYNHKYKGFKQEHLKDLEFAFLPHTQIFRQKHKASLQYKILFRKQARKINTCTERWTDLQSQMKLFRKLGTKSRLSYQTTSSYLPLDWDSATHSTCDTQTCWTANNKPVISWTQSTLRAIQKRMLIPMSRTQ